MFIRSLTHGFNGLGKDNCNKRRKTFMFWDFVCFILKVWRFLSAIRWWVNSHIPDFCAKLYITNDNSKIYVICRSNWALHTALTIILLSSNLTESAMKLTVWASVGGNTFGRRPLQLLHMSLKVNEISDNSTVCSRAYLSKNKEDIKGTHHWLIFEENIDDKWIP